MNPKAKFPIRIPDGWNLSITQGFHESAPTNISQALAIQTVDHIGLDVVCGTGIQTFGSACIWPFPFPGIVWDSQAETPIAELIPAHAHAQIDGIDPATGILYSIVYLHLSAVTNTKDALENKVITYHQGDVIGYIGNSGAVVPLPNAQHPFDGSHLHLGLGIKKPGDLNATMVDPSLYFDITNPFRGPDDASRDQAVIDWAKANNPQISPVFTKDLYAGLTDPDVKTLQQYLNNHGFAVATTGPGSVGEETFYFGALTQNAVKKWQAANKISPAAGYFGPLSRAFAAAHP